MLYFNNGKMLVQVSIHHKLLTNLELAALVDKLKESRYSYMSVIDSQNVYLVDIDKGTVNIRSKKQSTDVRRYVANLESEYSTEILLQVPYPYIYGATIKQIPADISKPKTLMRLCGELMSILFLNSMDRS